MWHFYLLILKLTGGQTGHIYPGPRFSDQKKFKKIMHMGDTKSINGSRWELIVAPIPKNPVYGRHWITGRVLIVALKPNPNTIASFTKIQVKNLHGEKKLERYKVSKITIYQVTKLPSYQVTKLLRYQVTKLPSYQLTKVPRYQVNKREQ